ncbi:MAG: hypothetical protein MUO58_22205 [Anaerolineales bacterium]|nr:hypothetical protein [Anaerolineales bacterium]
MHTRIKYVHPTCLIILMLLMAALVPLSTASADIGPHPSLTFKFDFSALPAEPTIEQVLLYQCDDVNCSSKQVLPEVPGQYWECDVDGCYVSLLTGGKAWQIEASLADQSLLSEPFVKQGFYSTYRLVFFQDALKVELVSAEDLIADPIPTTESDSLARMLIAGMLTILIEIPLAAFMFRRFDLSYKNLLWVVVGNILSIPVVWLILPVFQLADWITLTAILFTSTALETLVLGLLGGVRLSWNKALIIAAVMNSVSFTAGICGFQFLFF